MQAPVSLVLALAGAVVMTACRAHPSPIAPTPPQAPALPPSPRWLGLWDLEFIRQDGESCATADAFPPSSRYQFDGSADAAIVSWAFNPDWLDPGAYRGAVTDHRLSLAFDSGSQSLTGVTRLISTIDATFSDDFMAIDGTATAPCRGTAVTLRMRGSRQWLQ